MKWDDDGPIIGAKPSWTERAARSFSPIRGLKCFGMGLLLSPILIGLKSVSADEFHWDGIPIFILIVATICGLWGLFTKKDIPL